MSTTVDLGKITASVTVGTTTTGAAGTNASVSNSGTTQDAVLNFTIPRGAQGVQGPQGIQGNTGPAGPTGPQGPMGDVAVITPEQQAAFTMYSVPGQNTNGPMTQKAVTDALVAGSISYDNSQSGIDADDVQEAIDKVSSNVFENYKEEVVPIPITYLTNMYITGTKVWANLPEAGGYLMPFEDTENYYRVKTNGGNARIIALLDNSAVAGNTPSYVTGDYTSSMIRAVTGTSKIFKLPQGTKYIWVSRKSNSVDITPRIERLLPISDSIGDIGIAEVINGKGLKNDGTLFEATSPGAAVYKYSVLEGHKYAVSGYSPSDNDLTKVSIVCADVNGVALASYKPCRSAAFTDYVIETPNDCTQLLVFSTGQDPASLKEYHNTFENAKIESIPQIYNDGHKFYRGSNLKILCFGSSWFMDTWWYLNKLLGNAGVQCELHCYYMGHAKLREWLDFYNGNTTPFSGTEATRSASKNISVNGADWTISSYSQSGSYNANSYKNDFVADIKSGDWDMIAFQQGAQECIIAEEWEAGHDVVKMIKENCTYKTAVAFNATFVPALKNYSGTYFPTISRSDYGKEYFQYLNNRNTKLFMADTGIYNVSPNGAMLSLMRTDQTLNLSKDMANDGLHPDNGLPILGLCGCFYETFIAPLIGISFDELDWLPTSSTQKASVSGSSYQSCSAEQLATIKKYVKQALADRFKYYK